jgi:aspartate/methionine/tyrosine aminotransferase
VTVRADRVPPFHAMAMNLHASRREAAGAAVIHLEVGQPSTGAPRHAVEAVRAALDRPLGYTNAPGLPSLRRRIARHYAQSAHVDVDLERIMAVAGASAGFTLAFLAAFEPGARVGVIEPGYPCYRNTLLALDMQPVPIVVGPHTRWAPTPDLLDAAGPLDGLVVASPSNPTGTVLPADVLAAIVAHCDANDVRLVADEIYHGITFTGPATSALTLTDRAIVINSFSKYYSMTGWRIGWAVVPDDLHDAFERMQQNLYICAAHVSQVAALAAMDATDELDAHVARYAANRTLLLDGLAAAGLDDVAAADGAFYVYADVGHLLDAGAAADSNALCYRWLDELGLAVTPGIDFDLARGDRFVRFSYSGIAEHINEACTRLAGWRP